MIDPITLHTDRIYHYSLPVWHETGTGAVESSSDLASGKLVIEGGEVLVSKLNPEKGAVIHAVRQDLITLCSPEFIALQPTFIEGRYAYYAMMSAPVRAQLNASVESVTNSHKRARVDRFLASKIDVPDFPAQRRIADFLDHETARIDLLIEKKERLVEVLEEKATAAATEAATRGIKADALVANTGIEWLLTAPAHWEVRRIASIFNESNEMGGENLPVLSVSINWGISDRELGDEDRHRIVNHIEDRSAYKRVRVGDLAYNMMRAWQGAFGIATVDGLVSPAYVVARPSLELHTPYFEHLLRTPMCIEEFRRASKGIADFRQRLYWEDFRQVQVVLPPLEEQVQIATTIAQQTVLIERVIDEIDTSVKRLREFRAALVNAAVTGQIDVATWDRQGLTDRRLDRIEEEIPA